ncbi:VOC family protein [Rhodobacterales bacterium HKCCE2091]|nr:VOC family protein [Rhodobacterales bacterium HKCCE2091]
MLTLDHIVITAPDLATGTAWAEEKLGVALAPGGEHPAMGTHNRLLSLGPDEYLEVIAIDPDLPAPGQPRWFGLDEVSGPPRLSAWMTRTDDLDAALAAAPDGVGRIHALARSDFRWRVAIPETGRTPHHGLFPSVLQWEGTAHPAPRLPDHGLRLSELVLLTPEPEALESALRPLFPDPRLTIRAADAPDMAATLSGPSGTVTL